MRRPSDELIQFLEQKSNQVLRLALEMITYGQVGHPGGSLSEAEQIACLYFSEMHHRPEEPHWENRDRFIMSKAHGCPGQYAALAIAGYFPVEECYTYRKIDSHLQSHPDCRKTPGIEISGGSLGQGFLVAVGMALAEQYHQPVAMARIGVKDKFVETGEIPDLLAKYETRAEDIVKKAEELLKEKNKTAK